MAVKTDGGLRPLFRTNIRDAHWTTVESGDTGSGIPDAYVALSYGACAWIEYKHTLAWTPKIRPFQVSWHLTHTRMGGRSFIAVRRQPKISPGTDELWLVAGAAIERLRDHSLRRLEQGDLLGRWDGGPSKWDWGAVRTILAR